jgi:hypothetical protein
VPCDYDLTLAQASSLLLHGHTLTRILLLQLVDTTLKVQLRFLALDGPACPAAGQHVLMPEEHRCFLRATAMQHAHAEAGSLQL